MRTPPFPHYEAWSTAKFWSFIRSGLRTKWSRWPPKFNVLNSSRRTVTGQRHRYEYQCSRCGEWYKQKDVEVDHINPVGSLKDYSDLPTFVERLFVSEKELRVVCKPCHLIITHGEKDGKPTT